MSIGLAIVAIAVLLFGILSPREFEHSLIESIDRLKLLPGALKGDTETQIELARTYFPQLEPDSEPDKKRFYWFMKAAEGGSGYAAYLVGQAYHRGYGVEQDMRAALHWYGVAARRGDGWSKLRFDLRADYMDQDDLLVATVDNAMESREVVALSETTPGTMFRECPECPEMVLIPGVDGGEPMGVSKFEITVSEYAACLKAKKCWYGRTSRLFPYDKNSLNPELPIIGLNLSEIRDYMKWLFRKTGKNYRLPTRREWIWAASGGEETKFSWGATYSQACHHKDLASNHSDQKATPTLYCDNGIEGLANAGSLGPNGYGLYDVTGNAGELATQCDNLRCEPGYILNGNYLKIGADLVGWATSRPAPSLSTSAAAQPVRGLRIVRDYKEADNDWIRLEWTTSSDEKDAMTAYDLDNMTDEDLLYLLGEGIRILEEAGLEVKGLREFKKVDE